MVARRRRNALPNTRRLTIVAQDPSVRLGGRILTAEVEVPAEALEPGPRGYRVHVIDYDAAADVLFTPAVLPPVPDLGAPRDGAVARAEAGAPVSDAALLADPGFHAQNVYAIVMRTLARFEFALGRRLPWGSDGHQLHVAPHAFADANAFYARADRAIFFGYFPDAAGQTIFTCLSHDVVAHETTHAILDGLRSRYMEPSSPDQAAFHEGLADIVALLSVFSLRDVVGAMLDLKDGGEPLISAERVTREALADSVLLGLAEQMGQALSTVRGQALRRSVLLKPTGDNVAEPRFQEAHVRGELLVAAMMNAFLDIWEARLAKIGTIAEGKRDRSLVVEQGATVADHLLTIAIRAIDYCPPTDLTFGDYLSAMLTIDREVVPDDSRFGYRQALLKNFRDFGIEPAAGAGPDGAWRLCEADLSYGRIHFDSMLHDREEVFRFLWENRVALGVEGPGYLEVQSVRPSVRVGPDGFVLHETVAEYVQILTVTAAELVEAIGVAPPEGLPGWRRLRIYGGGALVFDEYGRLKYQIANPLGGTADARTRQERRLRCLWESGYFDSPPSETAAPFAALHLARATR
jgi:hypothetical protein